MSLRRTGWWPYRLCHINALHINLFYSPKDQSLKFSQKILRIGGVENLSFFESAILIFFFKKNFIRIQISHNLCDTKDETKFWWLPWFPANNMRNTVLFKWYFWHNSYYCDLLEENLLSLNNQVQLLISFQIACSQEPPVIPSHLCPGLQDLTARCLQLIPDSRPQARELVHHPVFAELFHWWSHTVLFYTTTYLPTLWLLMYKMCYLFIIVSTTYVSTTYW